MQQLTQSRCIVVPSQKEQCLPAFVTRLHRVSFCVNKSVAQRMQNSMAGFWFYAPLSGIIVSGLASSPW
jgi:hypothetical protein